MVDGWTVPGFTHERELGHGASGRVVHAVDDLTRTHVAIKYLDPRLAGDEMYLSRFRAAARKLSQLEDPNVVDFYDFVETPQGTAIVMERIEGVSLRRVLAAQGPAGPLAALSMLGGVLLGLAAAHARDVVHGSVRPANILVDGQGNGRLTDFAITAQGTEAQSGPAYAAPELWDGASASAATDLYAATAVFYECLTGRPPFSGRNMAKLHREGPIPAEEVPGPLRNLITRGLAKEPEKRPASAADFLAAVEEAAVSAYGPSWEAQGRGRLSELSAQAASQPEPPPVRSSRVSGRNRTIPATAVPAQHGSGRSRWIIGGVAALLATGVVVGGAALTMEDDKPPEPTPQSSTPQPAPPNGGVDPAPLIQQINEATTQAPGAAFTFRRTGSAPATGKGTFGLVQGGEPSYSMTVTGTGDARKPMHTVLVGDMVYVKNGKSWQAAPANGRGYPVLADQVRWGSSVANMTSLLRTATMLRKSGAVYQGSAPLDKLSLASGVGPMYAEMAQATGAREVGFAIRLDRVNRPVQLWLRAQGPIKGRSQVLQASYSSWGRKPAINPPR